MRSILLLSLTVAVSCGGITVTTDGGSDSSDLPPPDSGPPPKDLCGSSASCSALHVMRIALLGDAPRGSTATTTTAWKDFGENIDGKITDAKSTDVCTRSAGAPSSVQADGTGGIDNAFGANVLPIIQSAASIPNPSQGYTANIAAGTAHSLLFRLDVKSGAALAQLDVGAPLGKPAKFDGTDVWSPSAFTLSSLGATLDDFKPAFTPDGSGAYVFRSGRSAQRVLLLLHMGSGLAMPIPVDRLQIKMRVLPGSLDASTGVLSGVIPTETFISMFRELAGGVSKSLCGSAFDGIAQQIRQTQDILSTATNASGAPCDAISFGMGFEPARTQIGATVTETPITKTCP